MDFLSLRHRGGLKELYAGMARGKYVFPEYGEWLEWVGGDADFLEGLLLNALEKLEAVNHPIAYPMEFVVIPRLPLSKKPMISWANLQGADPNDRYVLEVKELCGRLGKLINAAVVARGLVVLDIDFDAPHVPDVADVRTRRGYHRVWYVEGADYVKVYGQSKYVFVNGGGKVEVFSGPRYLWSYPLQSRYLIKVGGKFVVKSYKVISDRLRHALASGDLTPITVSVEELREELGEVLEELGFAPFAKSLTVEVGKGIPKPEGSLSSVNPRESRFNRNPLMLIPALTLEECLDRLRARADVLPVCLREALFGSPPKGSRYYHLRLMLSLLPAVCRVTEEGLEGLARDFARRANSTLGEAREWLYHVKYFTGRARFGGEGIRLASAIPFPKEARSVFEGLKYCLNCPVRGECSARGRWGLLQYLAELLGV